MGGGEMPPHTYGLNLDATEQDARQLRDYLTRHCAPGEQVEVRNLWVGDGNVRAFRPAPLPDLDGDVLEELLEKDQTCMTVTV